MMTAAKDTDSNIIEELDWDDIAFNPHDSSYQKGQEEGREAGQRAGHAEGRALGQSKGLEFGLELGFYRGVLQTIQDQSQSQDQSQDHNQIQIYSSDRIQKSLYELERVLEEFPAPDQMFADHLATEISSSSSYYYKNDGDTPDPHDDSEQHTSSTAKNTKSKNLDVIAKMQRVRARFKLLTVQLGIPHFSLKQVMDEAAAAELAVSASLSNNKDDPSSTMGDNEW